MEFGSKVGGACVKSDTIDLVSDILTKVLPWVKHITANNGYNIGIQTNLTGAIKTK